MIGMVSDIGSGRWDVHVRDSDADTSVDGLSSIALALGDFLGRWSGALTGASCKRECARRDEYYD